MSASSSPSGRMLSELGALLPLLVTLGWLPVPPRVTASEDVQEGSLQRGEPCASSLGRCHPAPLLVVASSSMSWGSYTRP